MRYAKARYYNPDLGRFAAEDPVKGNILDIQSLNLYPYVKNNPLKYVDPDGRRHVEIGETGGTSTKPDYLGKDLGGIEGTGNLNFDDLDNYKTRKDWGANSVIEDLNPEYITEDLADYYDTIVIHHSERKNDENIKDFQEYFQKKRKYADIGYHFVIDKNGIIYEGRPINIKGSHVANNNSHKIGIVLMGNFHNGTGFHGNVKDFVNWIKGESATKPTKEQIESLKELINVLDSQYGIDKVGGHRDFDVKGHESDCPGNIAYPILEKEGIINLGK